MLKRARVLLSGVVQGVFMRAFIRELAEDMGIAGRVQNLPDGRVEIICEAEQAVIEHFLKALKGRSTPPQQIDEVQVEWSEPEGVQGFEIVR